MVPGELVEDEERRERDELVERRGEWMNVVEDTSCYNGVERSGVVELLEGDLLVELALRRIWIDREDVVARTGQCRSDASVAPAPQLVLWSRLGPYERAELDRLLWQERKLFEWGAFIWPIEDFPLIRARMRRRRGKYKWERRGNEFLEQNVRFRRYVLRELE